MFHVNRLPNKGFHIDFFREVDPCWFSCWSFRNGWHNDKRFWNPLRLKFLRFLAPCPEFFDRHLLPLFQYSCDAYNFTQGLMRDGKRNAILKSFVTTHRVFNLEW